MPTEQREVGICGMICQSLYLSYASASQSAVLAHAVATTPKRGEHAIRATGPAWPAGSAAHGRRDGFAGGRARVERRRERNPRQRGAQPAEARAREGVQPGLVLVYRRALALFGLRDVGRGEAAACYHH